MRQCALGHQEPDVYRNHTNLFATNNEHPMSFLYNNRGESMRNKIAFLLAVFWLTPSWANTESYNYPFEDAFVATVVGTPDKYRPKLPKKIPLKKRKLTVFENRQLPEWFWYEDGLRYAYALQKKAAPLIFLIAGTGGSYDGAKNTNMARAFYQAGFHVVTLSSPTHKNFILTASRTAVPGHAVHDAEDLYRVMELIWDKLKKKTVVTDFYVTGYSLGGFNAAFVTWLDEQRNVFNFRKALLINPPVRLYNSVSLLDRMINNIPGGPDNFNQFFQELVAAFTQVYKREQRLDLSEDMLFKAYEVLQPKDEELAALVGVTFRISAAALAFTSDVMTNFGYVKPKNLLLTKNSSPDEYMKVVHRLGFTDYFHNFFYPYYKTQRPAATRQDMIEEMSLEHIQDYLQNTEKIRVMHNQNDIILLPGEVDFFPQVFGQRAKIYPIGGHCGNMEYHANVAHMINVFKK